MFTKNYFYFVLICMFSFVAFASCDDDDEDNKDYQMTPPVGSTFYSNDIMTVTFESADTLSYWIIGSPQARDTLNYTFNDGIVTAGNSENNFFMKVFFLNPDLMEGSVYLDDKNPETRQTLSGTDISFKRIDESEKTALIQQADSVK